MSFFPDLDAVAGRVGIDFWLPPGGSRPGGDYRLWYEELAVDIRERDPDEGARFLQAQVDRELDAKRDAGTITSDDLPGPLMRVFPGELKGYTLKRIQELCKL